MSQYFQYDADEIAYLKDRDKRMAEVIDAIGHVQRRVIPDLFTAMVHTIIGQQVSTKAQETISKRLTEQFGIVSPKSIISVPIETLQHMGVSRKKAEYIQGAARKILNREIDIHAICEMTDEDACKELMKIDGIGRWSAEMLLLFSLQRKNILSFDDLAIQRGLRMIYHHKKITRTLYERYKQRFTPYCSIASIYIWAVAGGQ